MLKLDLIQIMNQIDKCLNEKKYVYIIALMKDELDGKMIKDLVGLSAKYQLFNR